VPKTGSVLSERIMLIGRANYKYTDWLEYGQEVDEREPLIG